MARNGHAGCSGRRRCVRVESAQKSLRRIIMSKAIGVREWVIAEGYIPPESHGPQPQMLSHETVCLLNASGEDANVEITIYYSDREPVGPYKITVPARPTRHVRFNDLTDPEPIPRDKDFSSVIRSNVPIVAQHTRLDSRQAENALLSTGAYPSAA